MKRSNVVAIRLCTFNLCKLAAMVGKMDNFSSVCVLRCFNIVVVYWQGYVERQTALIGSLTVREFLYYSAFLQLPGFFFQKKSVVEDAILAMSLGDYANKLIGGHCYMKGLPSGERRRVSIARELVMRPNVLFIDEPLYHLDRFDH